MAGPIVISKSTTPNVEVFFHQRANDDLSTCGVVSDFPGGLADPTCVSVDVTLCGKVVATILTRVCEGGRCLF